MKAGGMVVVRVSDDAELVLSEEFDGPVELGRQFGPEEEMLRRGNEAGRWRMAVARESEPDVSRRHVLVVPENAGALRLVNVSETRALRIDGAPPLEIGTTREFHTPVTWKFGRRRIELHWEEADAENAAIFGLDEAAPAPTDGPRADRNPRRRGCQAWRCRRARWEARRSSSSSNRCTRS